MCEKECICKTCIMPMLGFDCGVCYYSTEEKYIEHLKECRDGGIKHCEEYKKNTWWRRLRMKWRRR